MTQEEKRLLKKIKLWVILHPNIKITLVESCQEYCPYDKTTCPNEVLKVKSDLSECKITKRGSEFIKDIIGWCVEWIRTPKKRT